MFDREAGCPPLGVAVLKPGRLEAMSAKLGHRLVGQHAIRPAAVGNDLLIARQFAQAALEIAARVAFIDLTFPEKIEAHVLANVPTQAEGAPLGRQRSQSLQDEAWFTHSRLLDAACVRTGSRDPDDLWDHLFEVDYRELATEDFIRNVLAYCALARQDHTDEVLAAASADGTAEERQTESVNEPAKVLRIGSMVKTLLDEVRQAPLDEKSRVRLREIYEQSIHDLSEGLSPDLVAELDRMALPFDDEAPSESELRIAQAQLVGWLEGLFHGIQATLMSQQMAARAQLEEMRQRGLPSAGESSVERPGTYL